MRKGTKQDYLDERARDLMHNYRQVVREGVATMNEAFQKTIMRPARRFYVSGDRAYHVLLRMRKMGMKALEGMTDEHRMMFCDLHAVVQRMRRSPIYRDSSLYSIIDLAVGKEAPRFYITVETVKKVFYKWRKERRYLN